MNGNHTRRDVLRTGAAAGGLAALGGLAGCSSIPFVGGGGGYAQWLYAPGEIGDRDHYGFSYQNDQAIRNNEDEFDSSYFDRQESSEDNFPLEQMGVDYDEVKNRLSIGTVGVINGNFQKSDVVDELDDNDFDDEDDNYSGYAIYQKEDSLAIGVQNNQAVYVQPRFGGVDDVVDAVETIIDTKTGDEDRYQNENDAMNVILNQVGGGDIVFGTTQEEADDTNTDRAQFEGQVGTGVQGNFNGDTTNVKYALIFADSDEVDMDDIEDWVDDSDTFDDVDNVSTNQNGRTAVITGQIDTDDWGV
jgi:hypothetical protein